jgi:hypothetical protein
MQITMPNTPETLSYAVLGSLALDIVLAILLMVRGDWLGVVLVLVVAGGVYWFLCRHRIAIVSGAMARWSVPSLCWLRRSSTSPPTTPISGSCS